MGRPINRRKSLRVNKKILEAEKEYLRKKYWKRNRFCECGADSLSNCTCDTEKKWRYMRRVNRKINNELGEKAMKLKTERWAMEG